MIIPIAQTVDIYPGDGKHPFARTGQLSFNHLAKAGAKGVLLGHSEVGETPQEINAKLQGSIHATMTDNIVLLGEQWEDLKKPWGELTDEQKNQVLHVIKDKLTHIFEGIDGKYAQKLVISYEPGWGVKGSGKSDVPPPQPDQIDYMAKGIRDFLKERYDDDLSNTIRIIYGGSMSPDRVEGIMSLGDIDGFILGSAGTTTAWVKEISEATAKGKKERMPVIALNWKAYDLGEPYERFLETIRPFEDTILYYVAPPATDLAALCQMI